MQQRMTEEQITHWLLQDALWYHYKGDQQARDQRLFAVIDRVVEEEIVEGDNGVEEKKLPDKKVRSRSRETR